MSAEDVANAFINHYYTTFASGPAALAPLYVSSVQELFKILIFFLEPLPLNIHTYP